MTGNLQIINLAQKLTEKLAAWHTKYRNYTQILLSDQNLPCLVNKRDSANFGHHSRTEEPLKVTGGYYKLLETH